MKLIYKFAFWYLVMALVTLALGGIISYYNIKKEIDREQARYLKKRMDVLADELYRGIPIDSLINSKVDIRILDPEAPEMKMVVSDTLIRHHYLNRLESEVKVTTSRKINGRHYYLSLHDSMVESDDITEAVLKSLITIFILFLVVTGLLSLLISRRLLAPFHKTLQAIQSFRLRQQPGLHLTRTHTREFAKLNAFLSEMTMKAQHDYRNLKEFTENASHELQTPLAIIRGKLELLMSSSINDQQARLIQSAHQAVEKLSKLSQSLTLLTKLENREFEASEPTDFSILLRESLYAFQELLDMKQLQVENQIADHVLVNIHPVLADILASNLLSNAIRHNYQNGMIRVELTKKSLTLSNTGEAPPSAPSVLFERFKKDNRNDDSIGLGLAIAKRICEQSDIQISYQYKAPLHTLTLLF